MDVFERVVEVPLCLAALVFLAPLLIFITLAIIVQDGGPALFGHSRIGRSGRMFKCLKFRSMAVDAEERLRMLLETDPVARGEWELNHKLKADPRITPLGLFLRRTSLDELPQLLNVLRGDMSLVGPRPIVPAEAPRYGRHYDLYCSVRPGVTGPWQVSGRSEVNYRNRVALDIRYIRSRSPARYIRILVATVPAVLMRRGAH